MFHSPGWTWIKWWARHQASAEDWRWIRYTWKKISMLQSWGLQRGRQHHFKEKPLRLLGGSARLIFVLFLQIVPPVWSTHLRSRSQHRHGDIQGPNSPGTRCSVNLISNWGDKKDPQTVCWGKLRKQKAAPLSSHSHPTFSYSKQLCDDDWMMNRRAEWLRGLTM